MEKLNAPRTAIGYFICENNDGSVNLCHTGFTVDKVRKTVESFTQDGIKISKNSDAIFTSCAMFSECAAMFPEGERYFYSSNVTKSQREAMLVGISVGVFGIMSDGKIGIFDRLCEIGSPAIIYMTKKDWVERVLVGDLFWGVLFDAFEPQNAGGAIYRI